MYYNHYEIERIVKEILDKLGKEVDVKANLKTRSDCYSYVYGYDESYTSVKGLRYHFDKIDILGYYYNYGYYFSVNYNRLGREPYGYYEKKEDGQIINKNEQIWENYLLELYYSLDDLVRNQEEKEYFFKNYGHLIPWKKSKSNWGDEELKNYIKELDITLVQIQKDYSSDYERDVRISRKIYDGINCVYDSEANLFIAGQWQWKLVKYGLAQKKQKDIANSMKVEKSFDDSIQLLRRVRKQ